MGRILSQMDPFYKLKALPLLCLYLYAYIYIFPGGKCGRCVRLTTLPPSCGVVMKSWNLNFLESSGPLQACNGTDLLLHLHTPRTTDYMHIRQDRRIQTELASTLAKNATKPNPFEIVPLQTTGKENNWKTEEQL